MEIDGDGLYLVAGIALLVGAVLPRLLRRYAISAPIAFVGAGLLLGLFVDRSRLSPIAEPELTEHLAELTILIALMGVGLAIDRPIGWERWRITWRLLLVAMPACIAAIAGAGWLLGSGACDGAAARRGTGAHRSRARVGRTGPRAIDRGGGRA